ncbi:MULTISPECIES: single-stranded DNA-binding protein [Bacillus]|uniref:Single-stranded DNA-binding protein n=1 Tax=Bacillus glycinifermentans TaxID=1664069 RepID=A0A0T6BI73_9BACI|nr:MULTISPECIES: single-stranded DNA-binding protein [Bacillus]KRT87043.1 hypothetical protein AB447_208740 [Bacillus glycinifermentans]MEC0341903.1 single-stranded DNA-binding protein [Bacillus sonorensis]MEC0457411.1 single-stranded DNA-binding protein [Bacillus sonorensis]MEC0487094.1 single-stranded DNA-binding protein [Bacillus glycinifermentans]MEC0530794.1 single-stranded DNA-binding protein [Bacillus sonorensis]
MLSYVNLIGRITNEIKLEYTSKDNEKVFFYLAIVKPMQKKESFTIPVLAYGDTALRMIENNVNKGDLVCVEGVLDGYQEGRKTMITTLAKNVVYLEPQEIRTKRHIEQGIKLPNQHNQRYDDHRRWNGYSEDHKSPDYGHSSKVDHTYGDRSQPQREKGDRRQYRNRGFDNYQNERNQYGRGYGGKRRGGERGYQPDDELPF